MHWRPAPPRTTGQPDQDRWPLLDDLLPAHDLAVPDPALQAAQQALRALIDAAFAP
ncbi:MAG: hypothetical protein ACK4IA_15525 [Paracoccus hibiscisoli]|uniref:hypothetical protein n=1 Tax=Paracoccus hibiscisoli TaxID=2023261 RepID=UPI00391DEF5E